MHGIRRPLRMSGAGAGLPGARSPRRDADAVLPLHVYEQRQGRSAPQCNGCQAPFSLLRYRHRCDPCGMVRFSLALLRPLPSRPRMLRGATSALGAVRSRSLEGADPSVPCRCFATLAPRSGPALACDRAPLARAYVSALPASRSTGTALLPLLPPMLGGTPPPVV